MMKEALKEIYNLVCYAYFYLLSIHLITLIDTA